MGTWRHVAFWQLDSSLCRVCGGFPRAGVVGSLWGNITASKGVLAWATETKCPQRAKLATHAPIFSSIFSSWWLPTGGCQLVASRC